MRYKGRVQGSFMKRWIGLTALLMLIPLTAAAEPPLGPSAAEVSDFGLVSETEGWVLIGPKLYWTESGGQSWHDISPVDAPESKILAVTFPDVREGWVLTRGPEGTQPGLYALAHTLDAGRNWDSMPLQLDPPGAGTPPEAAFYLNFINPETGWLAIKHVSGSNFSMGSLYKTTDGGSTWRQLSLPIGEPVYFVTGDDGWTAGGAAGDELYRTSDGGATWHAQEVAPGTGRGNPARFYRLPTFRSTQEGLLPVLAVGEQAQAELYATHDGGQSWGLAARIPVHQGTASAAGLPFTVIPGARAAVVLPDSDRVVTASDRGEVTTAIARDILGPGIMRLNMVTSSVGWARQTSGSCPRGGTTVVPPLSASEPDTGCRSETRLLRTADGGRTWAALDLPQLDSPITAVRLETPALDAGELRGGSGLEQELAGRTERLVGQGFDRCEIATISQLEQWITQSPYGAVNLYIGGASRACSNQALSSSLLLELSELGWRFIPTWVGPQAPCTTYSKRMSSDPVTAHAQGISEANAAADVAAGLGLARPDGSGTIVYDDMEYYDTTNTACHEAVKAFISGWTGQLHARGSLAGVYANGPPLRSFAALSNVPDAIWPAHWVSSSYNAKATVWDVYSLSNDLWSDHQRIRQYTGGHAETWGGVSLNIDCNVIDGIVAYIAWQAPTPSVYLPQIGIGGIAR
jgi:photosystem II stability/assembly factor-like uncharacterized protein